MLVRIGGFISRVIAGGGGGLPANALTADDGATALTADDGSTVLTYS